MTTTAPPGHDLFNLDPTSEAFIRLISSKPVETASAMRRLLVEARWVRTAGIDPRTAWDNAIAVSARVVDVFPVLGFEAIDEVALQKPYVAAAVLSGVLNGDAVGRLAKLLDNADAEVRLISARALAMRSEPEARAALEQHAHDRSPKVREVVRTAVLIPGARSFVE